MPPESFSSDDPEEWLNRARSNLIQARGSKPGVYLEDLCFQVQQAAEKAFKALLLRYDTYFPRVHDLARLITLLEHHGESVPGQVREAARLSAYAVEARYPGLSEPVSFERVPGSPGACGGGGTLGGGEAREMLWLVVTAREQTRRRSRSARGAARDLQPSGLETGAEFISKRSSRNVRFARLRFWFSYRMRYDVEVVRDQKKVAMQSVQRFAVVVREDPEDGGYVASVPSIAGVYGQGESVEEAIEDVKETLEFTLEDMRERGEEIPAGEESAREIELTA